MALWEVGGVAVILAVYLAVVLFQARRLGLYYDELAFVDAALGGWSGIFVDTRILGVSVFVMNYLGALKSLIYFPVFKLFGVFEATVWFPTIALIIVTLM